MAAFSRDLYPVDGSGLMGIDQVLANDLGKATAPTSAADWGSWVPATQTQNFVLGDPVLDWLDLYGTDKGYVPDHQRRGYDERADFLRFVKRKGSEFEARVLEYLESQFGEERFRRITDTPKEARSRERALETYLAMKDGVPIIVHGVLWDPENRCYGIPDMLVRSDYLNELVADPALTDDEARVGAPGLGSPEHHYRVVEIKFTSLPLDAKGKRVLNSGSKKAYKAQVALYTRTVGRWQEYEPPAGYLLGRRHHFTSKGVTYRGDGALDRLGGVEQRGKDAEMLRLADDAVAWIRRLRGSGASWSAVPTPSVYELRPNASNQRTQPWQHAHSDILEGLKDPSLLWYVGEKGRRAALDAGCSTWDHAKLTPEVLGTKGGIARVQQAILDAHRDTTEEVVFPNPITNNVGGWQREPELEFFVDFETVTDVDDDFSQFPRCGGQPLILMIGCGYSGPAPDREWTFRCFTVGGLAEVEEARIIDEWIAFMRQVTVERLGPEADLPTMIHWSHAENTFLSRAYNSARARHPDKQWPERLPWFDFLTEVVKAEPIVVKGSLAFGLKSFATAMHSHGLISTRWGDGPADGLGAMVGAWWCYEEAKRLGCTMTDVDFVHEIEAYNDVDCRVMWEILRYLRSRSATP